MGSRERPGQIAAAEGNHQPAKKGCRGSACTWGGILVGSSHSPADLRPHPSFGEARVFDEKSEYLGHRSSRDAQMGSLKAFV